MLTTVTPIRLNSRNLDKLPSSIARPTYDRTALRSGIVHISLGAFHRAHQAVYTDDLLIKQGKDAAGWGICSVGAMPNDEALCRKIKSQDTLYTVVTRDRNGMVPRVIGSICDVLHAPPDPGAVMARMADKTTRIVSLTVTERGYGHNPATGKLDTGRSDVAADLAMPQRPKTALGMVVEALARRRAEGLPGFTVMSCDNLQKNGELSRTLTMELAERRDPQLATWIERHVTFPNTMVDRITPATSAEDIEQIRNQCGIDDQAPVVCEPFRQWVLEDQFCNGRPAWEEVGAQIVSDVCAYELTKLRLLNVVHSALCYPGVLAGHDFVHEATSDMAIRHFLRRLMNEEIIPTLPPAEGLSLPDYRDATLERFANPAIRDGLPRICMDGSQKIGNQMLPIVRERLAAGQSIDMLCFAIASFVRYCRGKNEQGKAIEIRDPLADELRQAAQAGGRDPRPFLGLSAVFGVDLPQTPAFVDGITRALTRIDELGMKGALAEL